MQINTNTWKNQAAIYFISPYKPVTKKENVLHLNECTGFMS